MAQVCNWLSCYLCLRESPKDRIHPDAHMYDAIIVWKENSKEKTGGMAYDVILKPACDNAPRPPSPPKERPLSLVDIDKKLKEAEERRLSIEAAKLQSVQKDQMRRQEAVAKVQDLHDSFSKTTEKKLNEKLGAMEEKKNEQIKQLQERLHEHAKRVEEIRRASEVYSAQLKERIEKKLEEKSEKRDAQLQAIRDRIKEHEKHMAEVLDASSKFSRTTEEKMIVKMTTVLKNREEQLRLLTEKLQEHEKRAQQVREKKMQKSTSEEACT